LSLLRTRSWSWSLALVLGGCDAAYSLPPTLCDEYCHAIQQADCRDDAPADCVRDCEKSDSAAARAACDEAWRARDDCFLRVERGTFTCEENKSRIPDICIDERRALGECLAPGSGACFDQCLRQVEACGTKLPDCQAACSQPSPGCQAVASAYYTCLKDYPVGCRSWFEQDTRRPDDIPCFYEALAVLACGK
jgi:hypothetical protein